MEIVCRLVFENQTPSHLWGKVIKTTCYLFNCLPPQEHKNDKILEEMYSDNKPNLTHIWTFECCAFIHILKLLQNKFNLKVMNVF